MWCSYVSNVQWLHAPMMGRGRPAILKTLWRKGLGKPWIRGKHRRWEMMEGMDKDTCFREFFQCDRLQRVFLAAATETTINGHTRTTYACACAHTEQRAVKEVWIYLALNSQRNYCFRRKIDGEGSKWKQEECHCWVRFRGKGQKGGDIPCRTRKGKSNTSWDAVNITTLICSFRGLW